MTGLAVLTQMIRQILLRLDLFYKQISLNLVILSENDGDFREKKYALTLRNYTGEKFAVGISWDKKTKEHKIMIEDIV